ncbi:MAG: flavin reductase family protein [Lachnospiraceae bacterium]|nr:flavin reductase family protein [Lachnospiraceae bacterium]
MGKQSWKPGNMLYPLPAVLVTVADKQGNQNIFTVAWAGTVCSDPAMVSISVRPERYSYHMIEETGEYVINLTTEKLTYATDYCGVKSGRDVDKFKEMKLTPVAADKVSAPLLAESPVNIECKVKEIIKLGTHDMFLAEVVAVHADEAYMDEKGKFSLTKAHPMVYSHGTYFSLGKELGTFGYSVRKKNGSKPAKKKQSKSQRKEKSK